MPVLSLNPALPGNGLARAVEVYDFGRPTTLAREHSRVLELAFETYARQWGTLLTSTIRAATTVVAENISMVTYDEYAASLPTTTAVVICAIKGQDAKGVIQYPTEAVFHWITRMVGGSLSAPVPNRKFTHIEHSLVEQFMQDALEDLDYSFGSLLSAPPTVHDILFNSQFAQAAATDTLMIVAKLIVTVGDTTWDTSIALPADPLLDQLGTSNPMSSPADAPGQLRCHLARTPVDVEMALAPVPVLPGAILNLAVGDVLPLRHPIGRPFDLTVAGRPVARAVGVTHGTRQAGQVVSIEESAP